jgi:hypothetical protein
VPLHVSVNNIPYKYIPDLKSVLTTEDSDFVVAVSKFGKIHIFNSELALAQLIENNFKDKK